MNNTLQSATMGGLYTRFDIEDTLTGVVRSYTQAPNELTEQGLVMFGSDDPRWHQFNRCLLSRQVLNSEGIRWGEVIPTNSNPDDPLCGNFVASDINDTYHGDVTKDDDGVYLFFEATKTWTFRQGLVGEFTTVLSGHVEETTEVPTSGGVIKSTNELTEPCSLTGETDYKNWKVYPISIARIPSFVGLPTTLTLVATDILTVTHRLRLNLPKYVPAMVLDNVVVGSQAYSFIARPYIPAYDALRPTNVPITKMSYHNSSEMTGGLVSDLRSTVTDGSFDEVGTPFILNEGDYTTSSRNSITIDDEVVYLSSIKHTLTFDPGDGQGKVGYLLINGAGSWYEVEITPPIPKRDVDKLSLTFTFAWG